MLTADRSAGYTFIGLLLVVAMMGAALALAGTVWYTVARREKEAELLFVGDQFRMAIKGFYDRSPGTVKRYPKSLQELLQDPRFPTTVRHLRRIYRDPVTGEADWGIVSSPDDGIMGVYSLSPKKPLKTGGFPLAYEGFAGKESYREWQFVHGPEQAVGPAPTPGSRTPPSPDPDKP
jgi:type II secretory pathway pseudopilin PulG